MGYVILLAAALVLAPIGLIFAYAARRHGETSVFSEKLINFSAFVFNAPIAMLIISVVAAYLRS